MEEKELSEFLKKFYNNQHNEQEHQLFINWLYNQDAGQVERVMDLYRGMAVEQQMSFDPKLAQKIEARLNSLQGYENTEVQTVKLWPKFRNIVAAACILIVCGVAGKYLLNPAGKNTAADGQLSKIKIVQGGNKAVLALANGQKIILDTAGVGKLTNSGNAVIYKAKDGQIVFDASELKAGTEIAYNTLSTPRGGQYTVKLPDGSTVWLNSESSLKFPSVFSAKQRSVELIGEGYFEISKDKTRPFRVRTSTQDVEVLGTHFNINAYLDEPVVATTLLEGSVKVAQRSSGKTELLRPGQQSRIGASFNILEVDTEPFIDWKEGYFKFSRENIQSIMRKVARWYDVEVIYEGNITHEGFVGTVPRSKDIVEVLNALKLTGVIDYKIEGKKVIITP
ncbi:FecR domain-containing protein [Pedobacter sp. MC2016-14]|uniref:FecR family protein n=1 Tax=Pedobacter sp. MC2016-14 TaxID=2897327 RepID=UPI001E3A4CFB|nr:FecR family protein [Pedobacter sp. MC2016-14]MCD0487569.1 FecR domain-containing protein [Pedobacter sp. MC2016-14]